MCCSSYLYVYCIHYINNFVMLLNLDQWYQRNRLFIYFSSCISPTRSGYKKLGLELVKPLQYQPCRAQKQPMGDEKKDDGVGDPIKMFLEEALTQKRKKMMDNFAQILRWLPIREPSSSSGHVTSFKVHVNFDIPLFEELIDADVVDKWLNLLEGYFLVHNFFDRKKITGGILTLRKGPQRNL